jgi:hypothetical protein
VDLSIREVDQFDLLQGIDCIVDQPFDLVDTGKGSFA